jgi:conjugal transfer pilus assembly protein TraK
MNRPMPRHLRIAAAVILVAASPLSMAGNEPPAMVELGPRTLTVEPGTNAIVEIAVDHLNRIVTPFAAPTVRTVADLQTEIEANVIYVATASETPATLYLSDNDNPGAAIGLTLAPRRVPPRELRLRVPGVTNAASAVERAAVSEAMPAAGPPLAPNSWARPQPYVAELTDAFTALAKNQVPDGYSLRHAHRGETVTCAQPGVAVERGQVLEGSHLRFLTARVDHHGQGQIQIDERTCRSAAGDIAAVAAWPRVRLGPGEHTEVYVAVRIDQGDHDRRRPSLLR